jgi:arylsulfatase A-like enzyme
MIKRITTYTGLVFLAAVLIQCGSGKTSISLEKNGLIRLMDLLQEAHITQTPFGGLKNQFKPVKDTISGKTFLVPALSSSRQKVWGAATGYSVLGYGEGQNPPEMEVFLDGEPLPFFQERNENDIAWQWIQTKKSFDLRFDDRFNKARQCLVLGTGDGYEFETFLPGGPIVLEISAERNRTPVQLEVKINGESHSREKLSRDLSSLQLKIDSEPGLHTISLLPRIEEKSLPNSDNAKVSIFNIKIQTKNDLILFFVPAGKQMQFTQADVRAHYLAVPEEQDGLASLFRIQKDYYLHSYTKPENPYGLKKKIDVENSTLDVLLAPPSSRYAVSVHIPREAYLEFGTGVFRSAGDFQEKTVLFQLTAEQNGTTDLLYERQFVSSEEMSLEQLDTRKIDLSRYAGQTIQLIFQTDSADAGSSKKSNGPAFAFWMNPLVYTPSQDGLNFILISLDTLRADHLSSYGYHRGTSPYLDQLAADGVLFEHVYAQSPWTLPSHMSMLFSLNTARHRVYLYNQSIDKTIPSLASYLKGAGYLTTAFTGGGYMSSIYGFPKGFDRYDEPAEKEPDYRAREAEYLYHTAADWLTKNQGKKFFLFLHTFQIHGPYECPSPWNDAFLTKAHTWRQINLKDTIEARGGAHSFSETEIENIIALYDAEIQYTDEVLLKPLIDHLKQLNLYERTVLIITSDHGEEFYEHNGWLHGDTLYNEQLKVPLIIKMPYSENAGSRIPSKIRLIDIMPTVLDLAGIKPGDIDGRSLLSLVNGKEHQDRIFISDLASRTQPQLIPLKMATNREQLKFIFTRADSGIKSIETFDLENDPREKNNLFPKAQALRDEVLAFLTDYYETQQQRNQSGKEVELNQALEEKLKALGYLR